MDEEDEEPAVGMSALYDSDRFTVVCFPYERHERKTYGFEIVDKAVNAELFLHGAQRKVLDDAIKRWGQNPPAQAEVEAFLGGLAHLALLPVVIH